MLPSLDDYLHAKNLQHELIPSRNIDDQGITLYDWMWGRTGKVVVSDAPFLWWLTPCKKIRYHLLLSRDIDNQRILQSDWRRGTTGNTQPKGATLAWWILPCKKF